MLTEGVGQLEGTPPPVMNEAMRALADAQVQNSVPEWAPEKFWDAKEGKVRVEDMGQGYKNLEKLLGREKVPVPVDDNDEEGWNRWYAATGRPEAPDKYEFQRPELPPDMPYDEDLEKHFRQAAHQSGLNTKQAKALHDNFVKTQTERHVQWHNLQKESRAKIENDLRREYGNKYEAKISQAKMAVSSYADPDFKKYLDDSGLGNDPRMIRAFVRIGEKMTGETKLKGVPQQESVPADLERAIANFRDTHKEALFNREHPNHELRVKELNRLYETRYAE